MRRRGQWEQRVGTWSPCASAEQGAGGMLLESPPGSFSCSSSWCCHFTQGACPPSSPCGCLARAGKTPLDSLNFRNYYMIPEFLWSWEHVMTKNHFAPNNYHFYSNIVFSLQFFFIAYVFFSAVCFHTDFCNPQFEHPGVKSMYILYNCIHIILSNFSAAKTFKMTSRPACTVLLRSRGRKANLKCFCILLNASWDVFSPSFRHCSYHIRLFLPISLFILNSILLLNQTYWPQG